MTQITLLIRRCVSKLSSILEEKEERIVKAIIASIKLIGRKDEVVLIAPTGTAADNIGRNTYYTSLGISIDRSRRTRINSRIAKSLDRSSPNLFGGLPIVILIGDFFQFPPVLGPALWREPRRGIDKDENGRVLWHQFKKVIILDE
ncbi:uncharacterized protein N7496_010443 [Penicillium cataractarum]|uniref:ATP-dependent DNA helicase n=1 Tax=Penicillium cataractarum TaxID=2100454 RepID=A0A9W9RQV0_9EURO|nr:uncharacterized protein N7496_010443 [Penicillium cataractarum]KAJ5364730.1 hypothetical protein N7496_010443 [Penicillium cataractarum]